MSETLTVEQSGMLQDLKRANAEIRAAAKGEAPPEELPQGAAVVGAPPEAAPAPVEEFEEIKIDDQVFKSEKDALAYATEKLKREEHERMLAEAHSQGVREALAATQQPQAAAPQEDNFDEQFYSNPKEALNKVKEAAKAELRAEFDAKAAEEQAWNEFSAIYPDLADSRREVIRILNENVDILGKMQDRKKAMGILATKTREYFDEIVEKRKPRTELPQRQAQVVAAGGGTRPGVTQTQKQATPLTMAQQLKSLRGR